MPARLLTPVSDEVIVMDDDDQTIAEVRTSLSKLGYRVRRAQNSEQAVRFANTRPGRSFILDINMGDSREQEGLTALERIKVLHSTTFVGILSNYPGRYGAMAMRLGADIFQEKTGDQETDVYRIVERLCIHARKAYEEAQDVLSSVIGNGNGHYSTVFRSTVDNYSAYQMLRADSEWLAEHRGKYVAFLDGEMIADDPDRSSLLCRLRAEFPGCDIFLTQVEERETVIEIPAPLSLDD